MLRKPFHVLLAAACRVGPEEEAFQLVRFYGVL
jgi:hypothetical protein